jgi:hypothetical protein
MYKNALYYKKENNISLRISGRVKIITFTWSSSNPHMEIPVENRIGQPKPTPHSDGYPCP